MSKLNVDKELKKSHGKDKSLKKYNKHLKLTKKYDGLRELHETKAKKWKRRLEK